ncbi:hypothetical protein PPACK8108_LOCUS18077 [Phakopsora pachyrhizi]|uniref:Uncharacterized protein n=1 Tax=Phakopsora pachyrhizi TaxID=170000 RepID=A0AAV0BFE2_PHAPC|nr:hypothetical protein PPACK8108_LOCUS18077 [Phakopsora pachyrhizi]
MTHSDPENHGPITHTHGSNPAGAWVYGSWVGSLPLTLLLTYLENKNEERKPTRFSLDSITREAISDVVKDVRIPDYHLYNLMDSGLSKDLIKSTESQSNNPKLKINASKGLKFDLNELPENLESEMSDSEFEKLLELESERESNINSNKRSLEPFEDSKSLDLSHSPKRLRTKSSITTERTLKPPYLVTEPEADKAPLPVLKGPQLVINQQNKNIELAKHSLNDPNADSSNKGAANNSALKRKKTAVKLKSSMKKPG